MPRLHVLIPAVLSAFILSTPANAQSAQEDEGLTDKLDKTMRQLMEKMRPALDEALDSMKPLMNEALETMRGFDVIDDPRHYQMPEVLPNGDIIIRRHPDAPEFPRKDEDKPIVEDDSIKT